MSFWVVQQGVGKTRTRSRRLRASALRISKTPADRCLTETLTPHSPSKADLVYLIKPNHKLIAWLLCHPTTQRHYTQDSVFDKDRPSLLLPNNPCFEREYTAPSTPPGKGPLLSSQIDCCQHGSQIRPLWLRDRAPLLPKPVAVKDRPWQTWRLSANRAWSLWASCYFISRGELQDADSRKCAD